MIKEIDLNKNQYLESLHDCIISSIRLDENRLVFILSSEGLSSFFSNNGIHCLKVIYSLDRTFLDVDFIPSIRQLKTSKHFKKSSLRYYTLAEFINYAEKKKLQLKFYSEYFNKNKCLLIVHSVKNGMSQIENEFDIELIVNKISYEWE